MENVVFHIEAFNARFAGLIQTNLVDPVTTTSAEIPPPTFQTRRKETRIASPMLITVSVGLIVSVAVACLAGLWLRTRRKHGLQLADGQKKNDCPSEHGTILEAVHIDPSCIDLDMLDIHVLESLGDWHAVLPGQSAAVKTGGAVCHGVTVPLVLGVGDVTTLSKGDLGGGDVSADASLRGALAASAADLAAALVAATPADAASNTGANVRASTGCESFDDMAPLFCCQHRFDQGAGDNEEFNETPTVGLDENRYVL